MGGWISSLLGYKHQKQNQNDQQHDETVTSPVKAYMNKRFSEMTEAELNEYSEDLVKDRETCKKKNDQYWLEIKPIQQESKEIFRSDEIKIKMDEQKFKKLSRRSREYKEEVKRREAIERYKNLIEKENEIRKKIRLENRKSEFYWDKYWSVREILDERKRKERERIENEKKEKEEKEKEEREKEEKEKEETKEDINDDNLSHAADGGKSRKKHSRKQRNTKRKPKK